MKIIVWVSLLSLILFANANVTANAMEGVFDRSADIAHYIEQINSSTSMEQTIEICKSIYISGISDESLAHAIGERLLRDMKLVNDSNLGSHYGGWLVKALGATGTEYARQTITEVSKKTKQERVLRLISDNLRELDWERRKDEIMSSRANCHEGQEMKVCQLLNLLKDSDPSYKQDAAYRMSWDRVLDPVLMEEIAIQLQEFVSVRHGVTKDRMEGAAFSHFVKMLGYSHDEKYRELLVKAAKVADDDRIKRQADGALRNLSKIK